MTCNGLSHAYGRHKALDEVSVRLREGEAVAILGANGAGKTTLLNSIAGLIRPLGGSIRFEGKELVGPVAPPHRRARHRHRAGEPPPVRADVGDREPQARRLYRPRACRCGIDARAHLRSVPAARGTARQTVRTMSGGERQMVAIGRALMTQPSCSCSTSRRSGFHRAFRVSCSRRSRASPAKAR